jgi:Mlc titration factor MtfA (ptsG expression regulator)
LRPRRFQDRWFPAALAALLLVAGVVLGALLARASGAAIGSVLGVAAATLLWRNMRRRERRRRKALSKPFPAAWRRLLEQRYDHYSRLPTPLRGRFEDDLRIFLAEKRITGVGVEASEELRLLVAASAVTLTLGWPDAEWDQLSEVLLSPQGFDRDYTFEHADLAGEAHAWGTVILSAPTLLESFAYPDDGYHVGLHEFAHLLDVEQTHFDGIPAGLDERRGREWYSLAQREIDRIRRGKSALDPYGGENPAEFFAVAVEAFFEIPQELRDRHREVYETLSAYFQQDPAAWDDERL